MARVPVQRVRAAESPRKCRGQRAEHFRTGGRDREIPVARLVRSRDQRRTVAGLRRGTGRVVARGDHIADHRRVDLAGLHRADMRLVEVADDRDHRRRPARRHPVGGHRVVRPPQRRFRAIRDDHNRLANLRRRQRLVDDLLRRDQCPASVIVFNTRTPRNSADGQPWLTAATCPGCALPQLNAPPSRQVDYPPTASSDPQKSVVVA